jgi:cell division protein FtsI/penicillin-binding protein 2
MTVPAWRLTLKRRLAIVTAFLALWVVGIEARLVFLQVVSHNRLAALAERQHNRTQESPAKRGDILDRRGRVLATSVDADTIYAVPSELSDPGDVVARLCRAFGDCTKKERQALAEKLNNQKQFAYVRRQVSPDVARRVADLNLDGIGFVKESKRFYPNRELAAHLLGWVGVDNVGLGGIESTYDAEIRGRKGTILIQTDARRKAFSRVERPPTAGSTVELTIDDYLQHIAERELQAGVAENRAAGGTAIVMNPHTGEILAMANQPMFNPNAYRDVDEIARRNRAVQDLYEPGSTFKVVTASAALEEHVLRPDAIIDTNPGQVKLAGRPAIREDSNRNYGVLSFTDVIVKSSNVGAIRIGFRVGAERLSRFVSLYGFGHPSSQDFPAESPGIVWSPDKWSESALASVSMGYQIGVTPLQMVTAVSSVANGGELIEPRVIRATHRDDRRFVVRPKVLRRTINQETDAALTKIMEQVVARGTAKKAQIPGYTVAGKTGTAQKVVNGHYSHSDHMASFIGFMPSRNPALAIVVVIDSPKGPNGDHGGAVAAPIFQRIAEASLRYLGVAPDVNPAPPVLVARQQDNDSRDATAGPPAETRLTEASSTAPSTTATRLTDASTTRAPAAISLTSPQVATLVVDAGTVPDVRGMSAREAVRTLFKLGINAHISGDGIVVSQMPAPGEPIDRGGVCRLALERSAHPAGSPQGSRP